jgi:hypothetical protein
MDHAMQGSAQSLSSAWRLRAQAQNNGECDLFSKFFYPAAMSWIAMEKHEIPSDLLKLVDSNEKVLSYMKQKKYHPAINIESVAITDKRIIFRKPSMLRIKKSYTDYSYADILNVTIDRGPLRSTLKLNLRMDGSDLLVEDIPNDEAQEAFRIIRQGIDQARSKFMT